MKSLRLVKSTDNPERLITIKEAVKLYGLDDIDVRFGIDTFRLATYRATSSKAVLVRPTEIEAYIAYGIGGGAC